MAQPLVIAQKQQTPTWQVVTPSRPLVWPRSPEETWLLNPPLRYVIPSDHHAMVLDGLDACSDLKNGSLYQPLDGKMSLANRKVLVKRHRDRGIGDLLFVTGPIAYLQHINSNLVQFYYYTAINRSHALHGNSDLVHGVPLAGPVIYDTLPRYDKHWFIEAATEYDEERDQLNVYDCLYRQIGVDPATVDAKFKRPTAKLVPDDNLRLDDFFRLIHYERQLDLRSMPYYVIAPTSNSTLRSSGYTVWLELIQELSKVQPVIVCGLIRNGFMPDTDMTFADFYQQVAELSKANAYVINLLGEVPMRLTMALVHSSKAVITLDSGLLYVAQGLRVPAISLWGPHDPAVRLGYDPTYMELAIWHKPTCDWAPCFAYRDFPVHKCPAKEQQQICEPLRNVTVLDIMAKLDILDTRLGSKFLGPIPVATGGI